jgi:hypothetical protein
VDGVLCLLQPQGFSAVGQWWAGECFCCSLLAAAAAAAAARCSLLLLLLLLDIAFCALLNTSATATATSRFSQ